MDPDDALKAMLDALAERDVESAQEAFQNLAGWIDNGGFLPPALSRLISAFTANA